VAEALHELLVGECERLLDEYEGSGPIGFGRDVGKEPNVEIQEE